MNKNFELIQREPHNGELGSSLKDFPVNTCFDIHALPSFSTREEYLLQSALGSFLEQAFYPGGERGKSVNIKASINREVTEAGAEFSIMRCALD